MLNFDYRSYPVTSKTLGWTMTMGATIYMYISIYFTFTVTLLYTYNKVYNFYLLYSYFIFIFTSDHIQLLRRLWGGQWQRVQQSARVWFCLFQGEFAQPFRQVFGVSFGSIEVRSEEVQTLHLVLNSFTFVVWLQIWIDSTRYRSWFECMCVSMIQSSHQW